MLSGSAGGICRGYPMETGILCNADRLVRTAKSGYTSVPQQNGKKTIRVLQLLSDDNRNNWNLHDEQNNSNSTFSKCINGLTDWNVV